MRMHPDIFNSFSAAQPWKMCLHKYRSLSSMILCTLNTRMNLPKWCTVFRAPEKSARSSKSWNSGPKMNGWSRYLALNSSSAGFKNRLHVSFTADRALVGKNEKISRRQSSFKSKNWVVSTGTTSSDAEFVRFLLAIFDSLLPIKRRKLISLIVSEDETNTKTPDSGEEERFSSNIPIRMLIFVECDSHL